MHVRVHISPYRTDQYHNFQYGLYRRSLFCPGASYDLYSKVDPGMVTPQRAPMGMLGSETSQTVN